MKKAIISLVLASALCTAQAQKKTNKPAKDTLIKAAKDTAAANRAAAVLYLPGGQEFFNTVIWMLNNPSKVTNADREAMVDYIYKNVKPVEATGKPK